MMEVKQSIPNIGLPKKQGLYDPKFEKDNCGIGFIANIKGEKSHEIVEKGLLILKNLFDKSSIIKSSVAIIILLILMLFSISDILFL